MGLLLCYCRSLGDKSPCSTELDRAKIHIYGVGSSGGAIQGQERDLSQKCDRILRRTQSVPLQAV